MGFHPVLSGNMLWGGKTLATRLRFVFLNTFSCITANFEKWIETHVTLFYSFNPRSLQGKIVTRSLEGRGGQSEPPPLSTFDTIHPIDLKFATYNKLHLYFQLSETTWRLICFHGNNSQINDVTGGHHLGFSNFQILFKCSLFYLRLTGKEHLAVEIHEIGRIHFEDVSI